MCAKTRNCTFLLPDLYSLETLAFREDSTQLTPPPVLYTINTLKFWVVAVVGATPMECGQSTWSQLFYTCACPWFFPLTPLVRVPGPSHACLKEVTEENLKQIMREMKNTTGPIWKKEYQCMKTKYRNWMIQSGAIIKIFKCVNGTCMNFRTLWQNKAYKC